MTAAGLSPLFSSVTTLTERLAPDVTPSQVTSVAKPGRGELGEGVPSEQVTVNPSAPANRSQVTVIDVVLDELSPKVTPSGAKEYKDKCTFMEMLSFSKSSIYSLNYWLIIKTVSNRYVNCILLLFFSIIYMLVYDSFLITWLWETSGYCITAYGYHEKTNVNGSVKRIKSM